MPEHLIRRSITELISKQLNLCETHFKDMNLAFDRAVFMSLHGKLAEFLSEQAHFAATDLLKEENN